MKAKLYFILILACGLIVSSFAQSLEKCYKSVTLKKQLTKGSYSAYSLNNFYSGVSNTGEFDYLEALDNGFCFPGNSSKKIVFSTGLIWIGKQNNTVKGSGTIYNRTTLTPGKLLFSGLPDDPANENYRVYRVRTDYKTATFENEIAQGEGTYQEIYNRYETDWNEWPAKDGAPYTDVNKNGKYEPTLDIPGEPGANETLWFVTNDQSEISYSPFSSAPYNFGIETQVTVWGYSTDEALGNTIFKKYKMINRSSAAIEEMYTGIFADPSTYSPISLLAGCDSTLGIGYTYNNYPSDITYSNCPAIGYKYIQGPIVDASSNEFALKGSKKIYGKKNLPATSFVFYTCGGDEIPWPSYNVNKWYNNLKGIDNKTNKVFEFPSSVGTGQTRFVYSGDPVTKQGWLDETTHVSGCRYLLLGCGPFTIAAGDTQEIVMAEIIAVGSNNLDAISVLKDHSIQTQKMYEEYLGEHKSNFTSFSSFPSPKPETICNSSSITIQWNKDQQKINQIESFALEGYTFQGYNIYQTYNGMETKDASKKIATIDIADGIKEIKEIYYTNDGTKVERIKEVGTDSGLSYSFDVSKDCLSNLDFVKGKTYTFAVSAYYVSKDVIINNLQTSVVKKSIEAPLNFVSTDFRRNEPGINYKDRIIFNYDDLLKKSNCNIFVNNPAQLTNHNYKISFSNNQNEITWNLEDKNTSSLLLTNQKMVNVNDYYYDADLAISDGMQFQLTKTTGAFNVCYAVEVAYAGNLLTNSECDEDGKPFGGNSVFNDVNSAEFVPNRDKYILAIESFSFPQKYDYEFRFTSEGSFVISSDNIILQIPFEIWNLGKNTINDTSDDQRLIPKIFYNYERVKNFWNGVLNTKFNQLGTSPIHAFKNINTNSIDGDYNSFKSACIQSGGVGQKFNLALDNGVITQNKNEFLELRFVDADNDGNPPPIGTVVRVLTRKDFTECDVIEFNSGVTTLIESKEIPTEYLLFQNYPNPFNPSTTIKFTIPVDKNSNISLQKVTLKIYDILGREVATIIDGMKEAGTYTTQFTSSKYLLSSGVYFYKLTAGSFTQTKKMILMK